MLDRLSGSTVGGGIESESVPVQRCTWPGDVGDDDVERWPLRSALPDKHFHPEGSDAEGAHCEYLGGSHRAQCVFSFIHAIAYHFESECGVVEVSCQVAHEQSHPVAAWGAIVGVVVGAQ